MIYTMERFVTMVRIITDSAADFEPAELERLTVTCIPLTVMFGEQEYHENIDLSKERFYELLLSNEELPKTAQASPENVPGKTMGMRKGMVYLCKRLDLKPMDPAFPLYVMYTNKRYVAEELADRLRAQGLEIPDERIIAVGAAIGSHVGPEACGLVYVGAEAR